MEYMTTEEAAEKWGISEDKVRRLCMEGKVAQAKQNSSWLIPENINVPKQTEEQEHHHHHHHHHSSQKENDPEYRQKVLLQKLPKQFARMAVLTIGLSILLQLFSRWNVYALFGTRQQFAYGSAHVVALLLYMYSIFHMARKFRHRVCGVYNYYLGNIGAYSLLTAVSLALWFFLQNGDYDWVFYITAIFGRMDTARNVTSLALIILFHVLSYTLIAIEPSIAHFRHALHKRKHTKKKA